MDDRRNIVARIARFNRGRDSQRLALKYKAMQRNPLAFFRGTCHLFCEDWPQTHALNDAPDVWTCGDLHLENFGTYKGDNRLTYFDIADFDEALLAPCTWDLVRLVASALIAARLYRLPTAHARALVDTVLDAYATALRDGKARWIERAVARGLIDDSFRALEGRTQRAFVRARTASGSAARELCIDGKRTLPVDEADAARVRRFMRDFARERVDPAFFKVVDLARRIAGTGSLGLERYTILIRGRGGRAGRFLLDLKLAVPSALAPHVRTRQPRWRSEADRIVAVQRRMQAVTPALLHAASIGTKSYVLRELMPSQDKLDLATLGERSDQLDSLARDLGFLVAWAELRSSGRDGSATIDELAAFSRRQRYRRLIVDHARWYAQTAWKDWAAFREAYRGNAIRH